MFLAGSVQLEVRLMPASHYFEVSGNENLTVSGKSKKCECSVLLKSIMYAHLVILTLATVPIREDFPPRKHCSEELP